MDTEEYSKQLIRQLAHNSKKRRNLAVTKLREWINAHEETATELDFMKIWKGLFYCMWMSDKPHQQNELSDTLSQTILYIEKKEITLLYIRTFFKTMCTNWNSLDQHRLNKYYTFVRRMVRAIFMYLSKNGWDIETVTDVIEVIEQVPLQVDKFQQRGVCLQIIDVFVPELVRILDEAPIENMDSLYNIVRILFRPFDRLLTLEKDKRINERVQESSYLAIVTMIQEDLESSEEDSQLGVLFHCFFEYNDKFGNHFRKLAGDDETLERMRKDLNELADAFEGLSRFK